MLQFLGKWLFWFVEELLTKSYFPDTSTHARSDASQLRRKVLAARLKRR